MSDLADDLLWGADAIAKALNKEVRPTYYLLEKKLIPAAKVGDQWVVSRKALRDHFAGLMKRKAS
jgi:hypothetical protein